MRQHLLDESRECAGMHLGWTQAVALRIQKPASAVWCRVDPSDRTSLFVAPPEASVEHCVPRSENLQASRPMHDAGITKGTS